MEGQEGTIMSESNQILLEILDKMKFGMGEFKASIVNAEMIHSIGTLWKSVILLIILLYAFKRFNESFNIVQNTKRVLKAIFGSSTESDESGIGNEGDGNNGEKVVDNKKHQSAFLKFISKFDDESFKEFIETVKAYFSTHTWIRDLLSLWILCTELKAVIHRVGILADNAITIFTCIMGPDKIVIEYVNSLFK